MKSIVKKISQAMLLVPALLLGLSFVATPAYATGGSCDDVSSGIAGGAECSNSESTPDTLFGDGSIFQTVTNILLFLIGAVSVIMLIIGGIRYVISQGDQAQVTSAKNTILYAIIGIIIAFLAYAAVAFVTNSISANN